MGNELFSKIIGRLKQNSSFPDWWESDEIETPFFDNKKLTVTYMDLDPKTDVTFIGEADMALSNFFKLNADDRNSFSDLAYKNCMDFLELVGYDEADEQLRLIKDKNEIWNFIYPNQICLQRRHKNDKDIYVVLDCECEWEKEHGLRFVFKQGKWLTRISEIDGHITDEDAYGIPDEED